MKTPHHKLDHVLWIGGGTCAGKTSIADILNARYDLRGYHCDDLFEEHRNRARPDKHPAFYSAMFTSYKELDWERFWMRPVEILLKEQMAIYAEEFEMIIGDLLAMPRSRPIITEGSALLPRCVKEVLAAPSAALWLIPEETFHRRMYQQRGSWVQDILHQCADPQQAFDHWIRRDIVFAKHIASQTARLGLKALTIDGGRAIQENVRRVEAHFGEHLTF
ncbi:MAG: hypothetical protein ACQEQT_03370 [Chloroflexota bacterium]